MLVKTKRSEDPNMAVNKLVVEAFKGNESYERRMLSAIYRTLLNGGKITTEENGHKQEFEINFPALLDNS